MAHEAVEALEPQAHAASLRLTVEAEGDLPPVRCDRERVQVLANLVGNAVKFGPAGSEIRIRLRSAGDANGIVEAHGGEIRVESQAGRGTSVSFTLPAASSSEVAR